MPGAPRPPRSRWGCVPRRSRCAKGGPNLEAAEKGVLVLGFRSPPSHLLFPGAGFLPALKGICPQRGEGWEDLGAAPPEAGFPFHGLCVCIAAAAGSCLQPVPQQNVG